MESYDHIELRALSTDEESCERHFEQTTTRTSDGRFMVMLPFRNRDAPIGNTKDIALKRLYQVKRMLKGNDTIRSRYIKFMEEYLEAGHMSIVKNLTHESRTIVYLSHHGVVKESSSSTKLRVVFDASAKNHKSVSLNDALLVEPVLHDNLIDLVIRFRFFAIAIADLQKMYRQVLVHPNDRDFQRCGGSPARSLYPNIA